jgi:hypothetical protein
LFGQVSEDSEESSFQHDHWFALRVLLHHHATVHIERLSSDVVCRR